MKTTPGLYSRASSFYQPLQQWNVANVTTMEGMFYEASSFLTNAERLVQPLWTRDGFGGHPQYLERWKVLYTEAKRFNALVIGEHVRADRPKTDGSAAGVAVGVVAQVLTTPGLAGELSAFWWSAV